jgi:DNA segregation ATPase FtsK/SpoIIIE-like protein
MTIILTPLIILSASGIHTFNIPSKVVKIFSLVFTKFQNETQQSLSNQEEPLFRSVTKEQARQIRNQNINEVRNMSMTSNAKVPTTKLNDLLDEKPMPNKATRNDMTIKKIVPVGNKEYIPPEINFLAKNSAENSKKNAESNRQAQSTQAKLKQVLIDFGIEGEIISFAVGPVITMFEF